MLLIHGEIIETTFEEKYLEHIYEDCLSTLNNTEWLTSEKVINACDKLYKKVMQGEFNDLVERYYPVFNKGNSNHRRPMDFKEVTEWAKSLNLIRNTFIPDYNYTGIPYITFDKSGSGPRLDFFREKDEITVDDIKEKLEDIQDVEW